MFFCTKCGKIIVFKRKTSCGIWRAQEPMFLTSPNLQGKKAECSCGNIFVVNEEDFVLKEKTNNKAIEVADDKNLLAVHKHVCRKCGYDQAQLIEIGAMYGDEEDIVRYKCGRCGCVEQLAAKV